MRTFIDTNVLLYSDDHAAGPKQLRAKAILKDFLRSEQAVISTQVLQEYFNIATRKLRLTAEAARVRIEVYAQFDMVRIDPAMVLAAIDLHRLRQIQFWDALIVRSAVAGGCTRLLTEDLAHGETYEGVTVENPFR